MALVVVAKTELRSSAGRSKRTSSPDGVSTSSTRSQAKFRAGRVWGIEPRTSTVAYKASDDPAPVDD